MPPRNQEGVRCIWDQGSQLPVLKDWNPWCREIPLGDIHVAPPADHLDGQLPPRRGPLLTRPGRGSDAAGRLAGASRVAGALHPVPRPVRAHRRVQLPGRGRGLPQHHPAGLLQGARKGQLLSSAPFICSAVLRSACVAGGATTVRITAAE
ncbi:hypothetical protein MTO96_017856 [Rhipicephalus appendiculatus]